MAPIPHSGLHPKEGELNSDQYIASLESRLSKLKGIPATENRRRKICLNGLSRAKDAEIEQLDEGRLEISIRQKLHLKQLDRPQPSLTNPERLVNAIHEEKILSQEGTKADSEDVKGNACLDT